MKISWYIKRLKTFSFGEVFYRVRQRVQTHVLDKRLMKRAVPPFDLPKSSIIEDETAHLEYPIFDKSVDIFKKIDWHLDLSTGRRFPKSFAHKIDIRSDQYGSAKHVWEVNRMQFMLHIAMLYKKSHDVKYLDLFRYHLTSWLNENLYMVGVNWYSNIEVNLRLICWFFCWETLDVGTACAESAEFEEFVTEVWEPLICEHAEYSFNHPSLYSSANNHLISEYAGLFVAACAWNLPYRKERLNYAMAGLEREILAQNTEEGVNREEAAEYIQFIDDFFLIAAVVGKRAGVEFSESYNKRLYSMACYLNSMLDCKFNYPMYGDGDDGFVLRPDAGGHFNNFKSLLASFAVYFDSNLFKRADVVWDDKNELLFGKKGREKFESMKDSGLGLSPSPITGDENRFYNGHYIFRKSWNEDVDGYNAFREIYLHFDAAPLGFLSIAAHGHADALSFILHVDGLPILVDPGTFTYHTHKDLRRYFVSTLAHNTVCVNGKNQANQAGPTMWLNHYRCQMEDVGKDFVIAKHDGYKSEGVVHSRKVEFLRENNEFVITDKLTFSKKATVEIPFHLHPSVIAELQGSTAVLKVAGVAKVQMILDEKLPYEVRDDGWYSEHFGEKIPTKFLYAKMNCPVGYSESFVTRLKVL